ncbi:hypothetical protein COLO4_04793 [Corchorus olitorius]|uniref:Uncharacterized protein n=1 Tax=Corchorus olitorius TaxID=93759 RepID=A0A1R3KSX7_9ROSI|nr:hypothetical protein COLO4_04793 [Corchorus olitorius]
MDGYNVHSIHWRFRTVFSGSIACLGQLLNQTGLMSGLPIRMVGSSIRSNSDKYG